jgi:RNA polymerase sigma-70 factor, ECF subfamily
MHFTDRQLVHRSLSGNKTAFVDLHRRHAPRVFHLLRRLTGSAEDAEDLTQETFLASHRSLADWRGEGAFGTWICGIAFRLYRNYRRRTGNVEYELLLEEVEARPQDSDPFVHCTQLDAQKQIDQAVCRLPAASREAFILVRIEGLSYREAADFLEVPLGTLQSRLSNATRMLRADLADMKAGTVGSDLPVLVKAGKENPDAL